MANALSQLPSPEHVTEPQMIAYLDGELSPREQMRVRTHLESCWHCRYRLSAMEESIENFLGSRASLLSEEFVGSDAGVERFRQQLARHAAEADITRSSWHDWANRWMHGLGDTAAALAR